MPVLPALAALAQNAASALLAATLLLVLAWAQRRRFARLAPAPALALALVALAFGCGGDAPANEPPPLREGSIQTLSDADTLLFSDQVGSLAETTSGTGTPRGAFAAHPFGTARWDTSGEARPFAGGVRDRGVGLDQMGLRALAPDLGVWTSPDPEALASPERGLGDAFATNNPYAYANLTPLVACDDDGQWAQAVLLGGGIGAVLGAGFEAYRQYKEYGHIESLGKVVGQAGVGAMAGAVSATAGPQAGLATVLALGAGTGAAAGVAGRLIGFWGGERRHGRRRGARRGDRRRDGGAGLRRHKSGPGRGTIGGAGEGTGGAPGDASGDPATARRKW